jgi:hypothetical protein
MSYNVIFWFMIVVEKEHFVMTERIALDRCSNGSRNLDFLDHRVLLSTGLDGRT